MTTNPIQFTTKDGQTFTRPDSVDLNSISGIECPMCRTICTSVFAPEETYSDGVKITVPTYSELASKLCLWS
jgi:hypothetical protein